MGGLFLNYYCAKISIAALKILIVWLLLQSYKTSSALIRLNYNAHFIIQHHCSKK